MRTRGRESKVKSDEISGVFYSVLFIQLLDSVFSGVFRWLLSSNVRDGDTNGHPGYKVHKSATLQLDGTRKSGRLFIFFFTSPSAGRAKYCREWKWQSTPTSNPRRLCLFFHFIVAWRRLPAFGYRFPGKSETAVAQGERERQYAVVTWQTCGE